MEITKNSATGMRLNPFDGAVIMLFLDTIKGVPMHTHTYAEIKRLIHLIVFRNWVLHRRLLCALVPTPCSLSMATVNVEQGTYLHSWDIFCTSCCDVVIDLVWLIMCLCLVFCFRDLFTTSGIRATKHFHKSFYKDRLFCVIFLTNLEKF